MAMALDTSNAAFDDDKRGTELARIMRVVADELEAGDIEGVCRDSDGNRVGVWKIRLPDRGAFPRHQTSEEIRDAFSASARPRRTGPYTPS